MTGSMANRKSRMPECNKMARMLRSGRTPSDLAARYGVNETSIRVQLATHGWSPTTGEWIGGDKKADAGAPLSARGGGPGVSGHYVGGGDNPNVVPTTTRPFHERPKPTGFAWPVREGDVVVPPKKPVSTTWGRVPEGNRVRKITPEQATEMVKRYLDGESSVVLARSFQVNERTVRKRLVQMGITLRTRGEALRLLRQQTRDRKIASGWSGITNDKDVA